jgi:DnaJ-class molecular chaperone
MKINLKITYYSRTHHPHSPQIMDIFKMAAQIANTMNEDDKQAIENMDMEKMISHVTKNVFKFMNVPQETEIAPQEMPILRELMPKTRDICFDLNVDLIDFYTSKKKKLNIKRKCIVEVDGKQKVIEEKKKIVIPIEKGMKDEQQIRFEGQADQIPGYIPGDIVITLIENEHPVFQRDGDNLIIVKNVNLYQIYDYTFDITHLDGNVIRICKNDTDSLHLNNSLRKIPGLGMPIYHQEDTFGDLFVRFNLVIPKNIEPKKLEMLREIFDEPTEPLSNNYNLIKTLENVSETDLEDFESEDYTSGDSETDSGSETDSSTDISISSVSSDSDREYKPRIKR